MKSAWTFFYLHKILGVRLQSGFARSVPLKSVKPKSFIKRQNHFIDSCKTTFIGGKGGDGMICFLQLRSAPMLGPSGGDGGNGGHVILEASNEVCSLRHLESVERAENGENGRHKDMAGKNSEHKIIKVPLGTIVKDINGKEVYELDKTGDYFIAARGGAGGKGNHFFLSNVNRHPKVAELGAVGEENKYNLEMRLMAHAGFIGFPNVGKSTLLRAISRARPKVASYPFTTLNPYIGIVHYDDYAQVAVADLPGLLPGAHKNYGLGISFLKHVERCLCLYYVIDMSRRGTDATSDSLPLDQLLALQHELNSYEPGLSKKTCAILANKMDLASSQEAYETLCKNVDIPIIPISGRYGSNVTQFLNHLKELYDSHHQEAID